MEVKELEQLRNKPQAITNILSKDFDFKWDGVEYTIEKGETVSHPFYLAEHAALHMAKTYCLAKKINFVNKAGEVVDKIMNKEHINYDALSNAEARKLAKEKGIPLVDSEGNKRNQKAIIELLKNVH